MRIRNRAENQKNELNMTSMIDIVFLLLVFFVMTFKVVEMEGDFSVRMPLGDSQGVADPTDLGLKLRLHADSQGQLASMSLNDSDLGTDYDELRARIIGQIGSATPEQADEGP
ncbi:MAG: ExbD/TolR family protein, partial [Novipirellula sp. JB048]